MTTNLYPSGPDKTVVFILFKQNGMVSLQTLKNTFHFSGAETVKTWDRCGQRKYGKAYSTLDLETGKNDECLLLKYLDFIYLCLYGVFDNLG